MNTLKLLIVNGNKQLAELYVSLLVDLNLKIQIVESSKKAQSLLNSGKYFDIIVVDQDIDNTDALSLCKWIRTLENGSFPFLLVTVPDNSVATIKAVQVTGCDDYLVKPFDPVEFNVRLNVALYSVKQRKKLIKTEQELIQAKNHRETVLDSLNLGTVLLSQNNTILYFNRPMQEMSLNMLEQGKPFLECIDVSDDDCRKATEWLKKQTGKIDIKIGTKWVMLDCFLDENDEKVIYGIDNTELMQLKMQNYGKERLIGNSPKFIEIMNQIDLLAVGDWSVLIEGKTGSGKELVAKELHLKSKRYDKKYLAVNCAELTETIAASILFGHKRGAFTGAITDHKGYFEVANGGTLFLDEIGDIPRSIQVMLLRAIEQKEIVPVGDTRTRKTDVRIITATNKVLQEEVSNGRFREDLYYRLNETILKIPTLAERRDDIPMLIDFFLKQNVLNYPELSSKISNDVIKYLVNYDWPGNIRQLKSTLQYAAIQAAGKVINVRDLPEELRRNSSKSKKTNTKEEVLNALKQTNVNYTKAAAILGISRATLYRYINKYKIKENV